MFTVPMLSITLLRSPITSFCVLVVASSSSLPAWDMADATALLTVETKVELICSSMVVAPVSVIFGAIAFFFSLT